MKRSRLCGTYWTWQPFKSGIPGSGGRARLLSSPQDLGLVRTLALPLQALVTNISKIEGPLGRFGDTAESGNSSR